MRKPKQRSFEQLNRTFSGFYNDDNYCGPLAIAALTGASAGKADALCKRGGREAGKGTSLPTLEGAARSLGYTAAYGFSEYEGRTFSSVYGELSQDFPDGLYMVITGNKRSQHATAIRKGQIVDYLEASSRRKVLCVIELEEAQ